MEVDREDRVVRPSRLILHAAMFLLLGAAPLAAQQGEPVVARGDSVSIRLVDVDMRAAVQALSRYLDRPVVFGAVSGGRVTLETPRPVPAADVPRLLRGILESQNYELWPDSAANLYRVRQKEAHALTPPVDPLARAASPALPGAQGLQLFVIHLRHAKSADVAATVNALYGRGSALGERDSRRPATLDQQLNQQNVQLPLRPSVGDIAPSAGPPRTPEAVGAVAGRNANLAGDVTIVPDERANSLLIRASQGDFDLIDAAVKELDVRPLQVLIEVLIAEVRKDRSLSFGVEGNLPETRVRGVSGATTTSATTKGLGLGDFVLRVMNVGGADATVVLRAASERGNATILSRPVLLAANNEPAEINVGSQRPFVALSRVLPTDAASRDQVVDYKPVGTRLRVVPTISADGYVMLDVTQEINAATSEQAFDAPVISTRSVSTRLLVRDGQTIVLGGLTDHQREHSQGGVPILSSIPWIGGLFGRVQHTGNDTELFVFLTPRVIRSDEEGDAVTKPRQKAIEEKAHD